MSNSIHAIGVVKSFSRDVAGYILSFDSAEFIVSENGTATSSIVQGMTLAFQRTLSPQLCSVFTQAVGRHFDCEIFAPGFGTLPIGPIRHTVQILDENALIFQLIAP